MGVSGLGLEGLTSDSGGGGGVPDSPLILQGLGVVGAPELTFIGDLDTGIYSPAADQLGLVAGGVEGIRVEEAASVITNTIFGRLIGSAAGGPALQNEAATFNNPSVLPNKTDDDTGIGYGGSDVLDLIAGASNRVRLTAGDSVFRGDWNTNTSTGSALLDEGASSSNPTIVPNRADDDTGIGWRAADQLEIVAGGVAAFTFAEAAGVITNTFRGNLVAAGGGGAGPAMLNVGASASVPTLVPNQADQNTGIGRDAVDGLSMIAGGLGCIRAREIGGARAVGFYTTTPIVQQTGVAVSAAAIHAACVALGLFTA